MNEHERQERGRRAANAIEEFVGPALLDARGAYLEAMTRLAAEEPWASDKITKLAIAQRVIDMIEDHLRTAVMDGTESAKTIEHARRVAQIPERKRTMLQTLGVKL